MLFVYHRDICSAKMKDELPLKGRLLTKTGRGFVFPGLYHQVTQETTVDNCGNITLLMEGAKRARGRVAEIAVKQE